MDLDNKTLKLIKEDPRFFSVIYENYGSEIYRYCRFLSRNQHVAEDITSQTFMKGLEKINSFKGDVKQLRAWFYTIARNSFLDYIKHNSKEVDHDFDKISSTITDKEGEDEDNEIDFEVALDKIYLRIVNLKPTIYSEIILLRYKEELEYDEIAKIVNRDENNVRVLLHRAMNKLKKQLKEESVTK